MFHVKRGWTPDRRGRGTGDESSAHSRGRPSATRPPTRHHRREPEGRRRQTTTTVKPRRGARGPGLKDAGNRPRPPATPAPPSGSPTGTRERRHPTKSCWGEIPVKDAVRQSRTVRGCSACPATIDLAGASRTRPAWSPREPVAERARRTGRDGLRHVFIDCPPSLGLLTLNAPRRGPGGPIPIQCSTTPSVSQLMNIEMVRRT